eukprot:EG_transcript_10352
MAAARPWAWLYAAAAVLAVYLVRPSSVNLASLFAPTSVRKGLGLLGATPVPSARLQPLPAHPPRPLAAHGRGAGRPPVPGRTPGPSLLGVAGGVALSLLAVAGLIAGRRAMHQRAASEEHGHLPEDGLCPDCTSGSVWTGQPRGREEAIGGLQVYVAAPAEVRDPTAAILHIHDIMGFRFPNARLLADKIAAASGLPVYLPDLFTGDVLELDLASFDAPPATLLERVAQPFRIAAAAPAIIGLVARHPPGRVEPRLAALLTDLRARHGADQARLGAVGYCWGGKYALRLGKQKQVAAAVACHPSGVEPEADVAGSTAPTLFLLAKGDASYAGQRRAQCEALLATVGAVTDTVEYTGTKHGFSMRGDIADPVVAAARDDACEPCPRQLSNSMAACHPSGVEPEADVAGSTAPTLFLLAKGDASYAGQRRAQCEALLATVGAVTDTVEYTGTKHGFSMRGDIADPVVAAARDDACERTAAWLTTHLCKSD